MAALDKRKWGCPRALDDFLLSPSGCAFNIRAAQKGYIKYQDCLGCPGPTADHREPPLPPWFHFPGPGICKWCNKPLPAPKQWWNPPEMHRECRGEWCLIFIPGAAAEACLEAAGGICAECGATAVEHHHVIPLAEALPHADDPWWQWRQSNLQALCGACHAVKTVAGNARLRRWRNAFLARQAGQGELFGGAAAWF